MPETSFEHRILKKGLVKLFTFSLVFVKGGFEGIFNFFSSLFKVTLYYFLNEYRLLFWKISKFVLKIWESGAEDPEQRFRPLSGQKIAILGSILTPKVGKQSKTSIFRHFFRGVKLNVLRIILKKADRQF